MVLGTKEKEKLQGLLKRAIVQTCLENFSYRCEVDGLVCVTVTMPGGSEDEVVVKMHEVLNGVSAHSYSSTQPSPYSKEPQGGLKTYLSSAHKELHASIHNLKYANDIKGGGGVNSNHRHHHHHNRAQPRNFGTGVQNTKTTTSNNAYNHQQHGQAAAEESDAPFICSLCLSNCTTYQKLEKHFQDHHSSNITYFCSSCNIGFESEADCSSHRLRVHPQNCSPEASDLVVSGGGDSNSGRSSAPTSRRKQSKPRKGVAEENPEGITAADHGAVQEWNSLEESDDGSDMTALRIDMSKETLCENNNNDLTQRNHNEPGSLEIKELLLDNSSSPRDLTQYCCPQCRELFGSFSTLEQHCYADHRLYVCSTCLLTFPQKVNRDRHVYIKHAGSKPFSCDVCGASFTRRDTLKKHKCKGGLNSFSFSPSSSRNSPLITCKSENDAVKMEVDGSECGLDLSHSSRNRSTNLENVDSKGSFYVENDYLDTGTPQGRSNQNSDDEEDQGGDGLPLALSLSMNESTTSPYTALNKKYTCDRCSLAVMGSSAYIDHCKVIHRRTPCLHCGKTFSQKGNMERHKRQHTGERPFQCSECPSSYTRRETLKSHMSQAHGLQLQQQQPLRVHQQSLQVEQLQQQLFLAAAASGGSSLNDTFPEEDDSPTTENLPEE